MSQNVTLSPRDQYHVERIKQMLLENKNFLDMSRELGIHRRTLYRKINKWLLTPDFVVWLKHMWLEKLQKVDDTEAFRGLTRLLGYVLTRTIEKHEQIDIREIKLTWNVPNSQDKLSTAQGTT